VTDEIQKSWDLLHPRNWICERCPNKKFREPPDKVCPKCGSEDIFCMDDGLWPCPRCNEPGVNYGSKKVCARCKSKARDDDT
jgi:hypothetical protein